MSNHTTPLTPATERVNTHLLATGDIVHTWGMRVLLGERGECHDQSTGRTVVWFAGTVTNPDAVDPRLVPLSFRYHPDYAPGTYWVIQGNDLATWAREVRS